VTLVASCGAKPAYRDLLKARTRERVPLEWARTQVNLGNTLRILGERERSSERLGQAVEAFRAALQEWTREHAPLQWARTQMNLGTTLASLGKRTRRVDLLTEALTAIRNALAVYKQAGMNQYEGYFVARIEEIEAAISTLRGG